MRLLARVIVAVLFCSSFALAQSDEEMARFGQALTDLGFKHYVTGYPNERNNWRMINDVIDVPDAGQRTKIKESAAAVVYPSEEAARTDWIKWRDMVKPGKSAANYEEVTIDGLDTYICASGLSDNTHGTTGMTVEAKLVHGKAHVSVTLSYKENLGVAGDDPAARAAFEAKDKQAHIDARAYAKDELIKVHKQMVVDGCFEEKPIHIELDRTTCPRFGAILLTGSGFRKGQTIDILFNKKRIFRIPAAMGDGKIPPNAWIWVPDSAPLDQVSEVMAVEMYKDHDAADTDTTRPKSNVVKVMVPHVSAQQLLANFNAVCEQYVKKIPPNPLGYKSGSEYNIKWAFGWVKDNQWCCGGYQAQVLKLMDGIRFNPDPKQREIMDGLDHGPIFSFLTTTPLTHCFVVVWPHGPALDPNMLSGVVFGHMPSWERDGVVFDPWRVQKPEFYELHQGDADWAKTSDYAHRWQHSGRPSYAGMTANPEIENIYQGKYPCDGGDYYDWTTAFPKVGSDRAAVKYIEDTTDVPQAINIRCPVSVDIADAGGHHAQLSPDGKFTSDLPSGEFFSSPESEGGVEWFAALPKGKFTVTMTGTGDGSLEVLTKRAKSRDVQRYPKTAINKGKVCTLILDDSGAAPEPLKTDKGESLTPTATPVPREPTTGPIVDNPKQPGTGDSGTGGATGGGATGGGATGGGATDGDTAGGGGKTTGTLPPEISAGKNLRITRWTTFRKVTAFPRNEEAQFVTVARMSAYGSRIIFGTAKGLFVMNTDGSGLKSIAQGTPVTQVDISADGKKVAWFQRGDKSALYTANADGSEITPMPLNGISIPNAVRLTADGSRLYVVSYEKAGIYMMPTDGSDLKRIVDTASVCKLLKIDENSNHWRSGLEISGDGSRLAFNLLWAVFGVNSDGSGLHIIADRKGAGINGFAMSGDGQTVAVHEASDNEKSGTYFHSFDGRQISHFKTNPEDVWSMHFATDGGRVLMSPGVRVLSADGKTCFDPCDVGTNLWANPMLIGVTREGTRACLRIDGPESTDQGRPHQFVMVDFNPSRSVAGVPSATAISAMPKFMLADGSSNVTATLKATIENPRSVGAVLITNGVRPRNLATTWYPMNDVGNNGDVTKADGTYTFDSVNGRTYDGKPLPAGPITIRVHVLDQDWNLTVADLDGLEVRVP